MWLHASPGIFERMEGQQRRQHSAASAAEADRHPIREFIPYPVELVGLERSEALPQTQIRVLMLRRFADPTTGVWESSTKEIARMLHCGRSSVQKILRKSERERYVHIRDHRGRTVRRSLHFGGFPQPLHKKLGLPPLRWDADFTEAGTETVQPRESSTPVENSDGRQDSGSIKRKNESPDAGEGTVPTPTNSERTNDEPTNHNDHEKLILNETNETNERNEQRAAKKAAFTRVADFEPRSEVESIVQALAAGLDERFINSFLALQHEYGLPRLQRACGLAHHKLRDRKHPLRKRPGAYVRWLLQNGQC